MIKTPMLWWPLRFPHGNDVRFVFATGCFWGWGCVSYWRKICLFAWGGVLHVLFSVLALYFFVLCILCCCQFLWIVHLGLPLLFSLTFISKEHSNVCYMYLQKSGSSENIHVFKTLDWQCRIIRKRVELL
jgi:hypothetical protein